MLDRDTYSSEDLLPIGETARLLGVTIETVRRWDKDGHIASTRTVGGQRRFRYGDIRDLIERASA